MRYHVVVLLFVVYRYSDVVCVCVSLSSTRMNSWHGTEKEIKSYNVCWRLCAFVHNCTLYNLPNLSKLPVVDLNIDWCRAHPFHRHLVEFRCIKTHFNGQHFVLNNNYSSCAYEITITNQINLYFQKNNLITENLLIWMRMQFYEPKKWRVFFSLSSRYLLWIFNHFHLVSVAGTANILTDCKSVHVAQLPPALKLR